MPRMHVPVTTALAALLLAGLALPVAHAAPPLIYEGSLTSAGQPPEVWPSLRFSIIDPTPVGEEGEVRWSTVIEPDGPISIEPDGRFVAYLEDSPDNPFANVGFDEARYLEVAACLGDPCAWVAFSPMQAIGAVPVAVETRDRLITRDRVLHVVPPDDGVPEGAFSSVHEALRSLAGQLIMPGVTVTIQLADGDYPEIDEPIVIDRYDGGQIWIVGNVENPENVTLRFENSMGVVIEAGRRLGLLAGLHLIGQRGDIDTHGILIHQAASATLRSSVMVEGFRGDCVLAIGGMLQARGIQTRNCGDDGMQATSGGVIDAQGASATGHGDYGIVASSGGTVLCRGCTSTNNEIALIAHDFGYLDARGVEAEPDQYRAEDFSYVDAILASPAPAEQGVDPSFVGAVRD